MRSAPASSWTDALELLLGGVGVGESASALVWVAKTDEDSAFIFKNAEGQVGLKSIYGLLSAVELFTDFDRPSIFAGGLDEFVEDLLVGVVPVWPEGYGNACAVVASFEVTVVVFGSAELTA